MKNKLALKSEVAENGEVSVKEAIERLNALYASVCENAQTVRKTFTDGGIKNRFGFYNNHAVAVGDGYLNELYPIPVVTASFVGVSVDIGFDIVSRNGNIGFMEFTVDKAVLVELDLSKLAEFEFAIYGVEHYLTEYRLGDIASAKAMLEKSDEKQFHIGFEFADLAELHKILDIFCGGANGISFGVDSQPKMLGKNKN